MEHDPMCGQHCPGPYVGKCRGGDCTLCDEADCCCSFIARVRADQDAKSRADERERAAERVEGLAERLYGFCGYDWVPEIHAVAAARGGEA